MATSGSINSKTYDYTAANQPYDTLSVGGGKQRKTMIMSERDTPNASCIPLLKPLVMLV